MIVQNYEMKNLSIDKYLVPFDFTPVTKDALHYALKLASTGGGTVILGHVVKTHDEVTAAKIKLNEIISKLSAEDQERVTVKVIEGNIFDDLNKTAEITEASVIVMGTHGPQGMQRVFGSNALKIVSGSSVPLIITQEGKKDSTFKNIVMPFSFHKESVQVTQVAASLAKKYDATLHLVGYRDKDEWLLRDMKTNQAVVRKHLAQHDINYHLVTLEGTKSYEKELMEYATEVDADLIAAAYFPQGLRAMFNSFLQGMIMNEHKIPVITINAQEVMAVSSGYSFLTV